MKTLLSKEMVYAMWAARAEEAYNTYGSYVDWDEEFYECPFCGEPVYACDWNHGELEKFLCPICEDMDDSTEGEW